MKLPKKCYKPFPKLLIKRILFFICNVIVLTSCMSRNVSDQAMVAHRIIHKEIIYIDPGHGGKDSGTLNDPKWSEKNLNLVTSKLLKEQLEQLGYQAVLTRGGDEFLSLKERVALANSNRASLFVSIHYNHSPNANAQGVEVFYFNKGDTSRIQHSKSLADSVVSRIAKHTGAKNRGAKKGNFAVIRETEMPAILIEGGFLSNHEEREKVENAHYRYYLTWAIACGIDAYLKSASSIVLGAI